MRNVSVYRHGTMQVSERQVKLYEFLYGHRKDPLITRDEITAFLGKYNYRRSQIEWEIANCLYRCILSEDTKSPGLHYLITKWALEVWSSLAREAPFQDTEIAVRLAVLKNKKMWLSVRDASAMPDNIRDKVTLLGMKSREIYELKCTLLPQDISEVLSSLINLIPKTNSAPDKDMLSLISKYGKYWHFLGCRYARFIFPFKANWDMDENLSKILLKSIELNKKPLEWKGSPFYPEELASELPELSKQHVHDAINKAIELNFFRRYKGLLLMTGQGYGWLEIYFSKNDLAKPVYDFSVRRLNEETFWLRLAMPQLPKIPATGNQKIEDGWLVYTFKKDELPAVIGAFIDGLTEDQTSIQPLFSF